MVELVNSSIHDMTEFTLCGRVSAQSFFTEYHVWQNLVFKVVLRRELYFVLVLI